jgi:hypothetical protein
MSRINVPIIPRKMNFDLARRSTQDWCRDNLLHSAYMNGASLALPLGEHFFIRTVRQFDQDITDPKLREEIKDFIAQEAIHSRQHEIYNQLLIRDGYDIAPLEQRTRDVLEEVWQTSSPMERLANTIALEHITHVLGDQMLTHSNRLRAWDSEYRAFWLWHAAEEVEHKAVCFDLYQKLGGTYLMRTKALVAMTARMLEIFWKNQHDLLEQTCRMRGLDMFTANTIRKSNLEFIFGTDGVLRGSERAYFSWFILGFHPWKHDNRKALDNWKQHVLPLNHISNLKSLALASV